MKAGKALYFFPLCLCAAVNSDGDYQFWQRNNFQYRFAKQWACLVSTEARIGDNVSKPYYCYVQPQLSYAPADWIVIAPGYRQVVKRYPSNSIHWIPEYIPMLDLTLKGDAKGWKIEDRNRLEYIITESSSYPWLYRNRLRVYLPLHWTRLDITPFVDNEIFLRQAEGLHEDRLEVGLRETYASGIFTETSYMARFQKGARGWIYQNVFVLAFSVIW